MGRLEQWRKGKPLGLVMVAEAAARGAGDCLELLTMLREGDTFNALAGLPDQATWLRLYHRHAAVGRSVRRSICAVLPDEVSSMVEAWFWFQRHPKEIKGIANSVSAADLAIATGRLKSLGGAEGIRRAVERAVEGMDCGATFGRPEILFLMRVAFACWLEYGLPVGVLLRRARQGSMESIEKILWLDKTAIFEPRIAAQWRAVNLEPRGEKCKAMAAALSSPPMARIDIRRVKSAMAGLISAISMGFAKATAKMPKGQRVKALTSPEIRGLFDAIAEDSGRGGIDTDLPDGLEAFAKAVQRWRGFWRF